MLRLPQAQRLKLSMFSSTMMDVIREFSSFIDLTPLVNCQRKIVNRLIHLLRNPETETNIYSQHYVRARRANGIAHERKSLLAPLPSNPEEEIMSKLQVQAQPKHDQGNPKRDQLPTHQIPPWRQRALFVEALFNIVKRLKSAG